MGLGFLFRRFCSFLKLRTQVVHSQNEDVVILLILKNLVWLRDVFPHNTSHLYVKMASYRLLSRHRFTVTVLLSICGTCPSLGLLPLSLRAEMSLSVSSEA